MTNSTFDDTSGISRDSSMAHALNPMVSVCIPLFNGDRFVRDTINSVLDQTYTNWELIISDDGSTDDSEHIARSYSDERVKYYRNEQQSGMEDNFNSLLALARGKYIKILCQDDILLPECLLRQVETMETPEFECVAMVSCANELIDAAGTRIMSRRWKKQNAYVAGKRAILETLRAGYNLIGEPSSVLMRASACKDAGFFDATFPYIIDLDYWIRLLTTNDLYYLATPLCKFRISKYSAGFLMSGQQKKQLIEYVSEKRRKNIIALSTSDIISCFLRANIRASLRKILYITHSQRLALTKG